MPAGSAEGIRRGMYRLGAGGGSTEQTAEQAAKPGTAPRSRPDAVSHGARHVRLLGSGAILREVEAAAEMLHNDHGISAEVWSVTSFTELRRDGLRAEREHLLHPTAKRRRPWVEACLGTDPSPVVAATDYLRAFADQIRAWIPGRYLTLGTDGFGRSDTRQALRGFFEVDRRWITVAALKALADAGTLPAATVAEAIDGYGINPEKPDPTTV